MSKPLTTEERNKQFAKLSKKAQRIAIATDVLEQLKLDQQARAFTVTPGVYFRIQKDEFTVTNEDLQTELQTCGVQCEVCAKGALFAMKALNYNQVKVSSYAAYTVYVENPQIVSALNMFTPFQLDLIEAAFESSIVQYNHINTPANYLQIKSASCFYQGLDAEEKLLRIMQNVIDNNGTFKAPTVAMCLKNGTMDKWEVEYARSASRDYQRYSN